MSQKRSFAVITSTGLASKVLIEQGGVYTLLLKVCMY